MRITIEQKKIAAALGHSLFNNALTDKAEGMSRSMAHFNAAPEKEFTAEVKRVIEMRTGARRHRI